MVMRSLWSRTYRRPWASAGVASDARAMAAAERASTDARRIGKVLVFHPTANHAGRSLMFRTIAAFWRRGSHSFATARGQICHLPQSFALKCAGPAFCRVKSSPLREEPALLRIGPKVRWAPQAEAGVGAFGPYVSLNSRSPSFSIEVTSLSPA